MFILMFGFFEHLCIVLYIRKRPRFFFHWKSWLHLSFFLFLKRTKSSFKLYWVCFARRYEWFKNFSSLFCRSIVLSRFSIFKRPSLCIKHFFFVCSHYFFGVFVSVCCVPVWVSLWRILFQRCTVCFSDCTTSLSPWGSLTSGEVGGADWKGRREVGWWDPQIRFSPRRCFCYSRMKPDNFSTWSQIILHTGVLRLKQGGKGLF